MLRSRRGSTVLALRVPTDFSRRLANEARRRRVTRSEVACAILENALEGLVRNDLASEARRQSALAATGASDLEVLQFIGGVADIQGWQ